MNRIILKIKPMVFGTNASSPSPIDKGPEVRGFNPVWVSQCSSCRLDLELTFSVFMGMVGDLD